MALATSDDTSCCPFLRYASPIHLPRTTASSRAKQPPWPKSCVMGCMASPATDLKDVKIWQVHTLLKGLEKIDVSVDIPMLVCGDFNSVPGSAPHALQALGKVDHMHPELAVDPLGILCPANKLLHQLSLVNAYSSFARIGVDLGFEQQKRRMDPNTNEPLFTNCTRDFLKSKEFRHASTEKLRDHEVSHTHSNKGVVGGTMSAVSVAGAIGVGAGIWFWKKVRVKVLVTYGVQSNENRLF
ncbi:hypothetical protein POM88_034758 [Heracleum sosnowskyi]|uniref:Endonuclease/exonuclease/phosphatase domain-containing protein n=1 Tax=Heracleum sosnowskyi TaxID=360622 RepID=A0AAD8HL63_9APIA|nr:hypothetical protein POM88_034758 [Heracleum sosnowskyi]